MDLEPLKQALAAAVPFNRHVGLEYGALAAGRAEVVLPSAPHLKNHLGTQHAAALFGAGEAASGAAFVAAFADLLTDLAPVVESASVRYLAPARGPIRATATLAEDAAAVRARLEAEGRTKLTVAVDLRDEKDTQVATMEVLWVLRRARRPE